MINIIIASVLALNIIFSCVAMEDQHENAPIIQRSSSDGDTPNNSEPPIFFRTLEEVDKGIQKLIVEKRVIPAPFHGASEVAVDVHADLRKKKLIGLRGQLKKALSAEELLTHMRALTKKSFTVEDDESEANIKRANSDDPSRFSTPQSKKRNSLNVLPRKKGDNESKEKDEKIENREGNLLKKIEELKINNSDPDGDYDFSEVF